ncbi:MAG: hypothetical protein ABL921_31460 [Pirellula sp.]
MSSISRRRFLSVAASTSAVGTASFQPGFLPLLRAEDVKLDAEHVKFRPEIEPLVRLIEETPRETIVDKVLAEIKAGTSYRELLAALFLAGIRNVPPRPAVGFKFHCVLVVNAAHQASMAASDNARWLPLLWAIDYFKSSQSSDANEKEGDWRMPAVNSSRLPAPDRAIATLDQAFTDWDESAADAAAAAATHVATSSQLLDMYAKFAARDFRSIGHKSIYVSGAFRTLSVIGWEHAEPVMRSLAFAIMNHTGEQNPSKNDLEADRAGRFNWGIVDTISSNWLFGTKDETASLRVLEGLRQLSPTESSKMVVEMINKGVHPRSIYDGILLASAELVSRQPAIVPLHSITTSNAMHALFYQVTDDRLRKWLLLQNASFLAHFREAANVREKMTSNKLDAMEAPSGKPSSVDEIFSKVRKDKPAAATDIFHFLHAGGRPEQILQKARELVFLKGTDSHDYKFSSAAIEDSAAISPKWRMHYLAGCSHLLHGTTEPTTALAQKVLAFRS